MTTKLLYYKAIVISLTAILSIFFTQKSFSQCTVTNNTVTVCNKETNTSLQNFNLFDELGTTHTTGGTWTAQNPQNNSALNETTGIVNLWQINSSGAHSFIYTNESCGDIATITILLGAYTGEDNIEGGANACSDEIAVDLFSFLGTDINNLTIDNNGVWTGDALATPHLSGEIFNATNAGVGTYTFTYSSNSGSTCSPDSSTVILEVHRDPNSGIGSDLIICDSNDLSAYTNFNLFDLLSNYDTNGIWSDPNGTSQIIPFSTDSFINIQEIYSNANSGIYNFEYNVTSPEVYCKDKTTEVRIIIPEVKGILSVKNFCKLPVSNGMTTVTLTHEKSFDIPTFTYTLEYEIINLENNQSIHTGFAPITAVGSPTYIEENGTATSTTTFTFDNSIINQVGSYKIAMKSMSNVNGIICSAFDIIEDEFTIYDASISQTKQCFNKDEIVNITIDNYTDNLGNLITGNETLNYSTTYQEFLLYEFNQNGINNGYILDDVNTISNTITNTIEFVNGSAIIPIPLSALPNDIGDGIMGFSFNGATGALDCLQTNFPVIFTPDDIALDLFVDNDCDATEMKVIINAPQLPNGNYSITYDVVETNSTEVLINNTINFFGGNAEYNVGVSDLDEGNYNIILRSTQNDIHPCRTEFKFELTESFSIGGTPETPTLSTNQNLCLSNYQPSGPTISDIIVDSGDNLTWYENETSTTSLATNTLLEDGEDYFVTAQNTENLCEESPRAVVNITIDTVNSVSGTTMQVFCEMDNPSLSDIIVSTSNNNQIIWFDSLIGGNELANTTSIIDGNSYYATARNEICDALRTEFIVSIISPVINISSNVYCATASDTLTNIKNLASTQDPYQLVWYNSLGEIITDFNTPITQNDTYFVSSLDPVSGCESPKNQISVFLNSLISSNDTNPSFCDDDDATVAFLDAKTTNGGNIIWYDSLIGGNQISINTLLENNTSYFAAERIQTCEGRRIEFKPNIITSPIPIVDSKLCVNKPINTILTLSDLKTYITLDSEFELIWYDDFNKTNILPTTTEVSQLGLYYVASIHPKSGCESEITSVLTNITSIVFTDNTNPTFCSSNNLILANLDANVQNGGSLIWYNSNGIELNQNSILQNDTSYFATERFNACESEKTEFKVSIITPTLPEYFGSDLYCATSNETIDDLHQLLSTDSNATLTWYDAPSLGNVLTTTDSLTSNVYYVANSYTDSNTFICESDRIAIEVHVIEDVSVGDTVPVFCFDDNATISDLDATAIDGTLIWFNESGNEITTNEILIEGKKYFAAQQFESCESNRIAFTPNIINPSLPKFEGENELCALVKPTIVTLNEDISIDDKYISIWYDAQEGGNELTSTDELQDSTSYYVASLHEESGCESERLEVSISLNNCSPENYDFFIPDGFSPNDDGINDNYFIPNIEYFYPDYEYEIFNRYGQVVFEGNIDKPRWDGTNKTSSKTVTTGVYFYILKYNRYDLKPKQGRIYLSK